MSPVGNGELSLTKFYRLRELVNELAAVKPGIVPTTCTASSGVVTRNSLTI